MNSAVKLAVTGPDADPEFLPVQLWRLKIADLEKHGMGSRGSKLWVFNAQLYILPYFRDSFSPISDISWTSKLIKIVLYCNQFKILLCYYTLCRFVFYLIFMKKS